MKKLLTINKYTLIIIFLFVSFSSLAAPPGGGPPSPPGEGNTEDIPINMYWFVLLATGAYYGIRKLR